LDFTAQGAEVFGFFAKPDLTLPERAALMLTLVQSSLMAFVKHRSWLSEDHRATVIGSWLERNGKKAGLVFRGRISAAADEIAKYLAGTQDTQFIVDLHALLERGQHLKPGESPALEAKIHALMAECEPALVAKGLAA
jgi:hypothetical protein